jgi:hypothetical protein
LNCEIRGEKKKIVKCCKTYRARLSAKINKIKDIKKPKLAFELSVLKIGA